MVGLIDIAPRAEIVQVQVRAFRCTASRQSGLAHLLGRFPELRKLMTGQEVEIEQLMAMGGDAVAAIIAAGCGYPGDQAAEDIAARLTIETQVDLLSAILRLTLPGGFGPFVEKLNALGGLIQPAAPGGTGDGPSATAPASS
jgi:hypothetical protein